MYYEIRHEQAKPGRGDELARCMDELVIPLHTAMGMCVVASFTDLDDDDTFVWIRRFDSEHHQREVLDAVHRDARWTADIEPVVRELIAVAGAVTVRLTPTAASTLR